MKTLEAILIILAFLWIGLVLFYSALKLTERGTKKQVAVRTLFKGFGQKMWMTAGIGLVFSCLFLLTVVLVAYFQEPESRLALFFTMYKYPTFFIYLGLFIFALTTTGIYLVRLVIKHLYNTKKKY